MATIVRNQKKIEAASTNGSKPASKTAPAAVPAPSETPKRGRPAGVKPAVVAAPTAKIAPVAVKETNPSAGHIKANSVPRKPAGESRRKITLVEFIEAKIALNEARSEFYKANIAYHPFSEVAAELPGKNKAALAKLKADLVAARTAEKEAAKKASGKK